MRRVYRVDSIEKRHHRPKGGGRAVGHVDINSLTVCRREPERGVTVRFNSRRSRNAIEHNVVGIWISKCPRRKRNGDDVRLFFFYLRKSKKKEIPPAFFRLERSENEVCVWFFFHFERRFVIRTLPLNFCFSEKPFGKRTKRVPERVEPPEKKLGSEISLLREGGEGETASILRTRGQFFFFRPLSLFLSPTTSLIAIAKFISFDIRSFATFND